MEKKEYDLIVIGAGAGGLVVAIGAAKAGKNVLLIEKGRYGGDCTNFGCIPSKSLIAAAEVAHALRSHKRYGLQTSIGPIDATQALARTRKIVKDVRAHEEPEVLEKHGVATLTGEASFVDPHTLEVAIKEGRKVVTAKNIVIATGSRPKIPTIPGIDDVPFCTNETIFDLEKIPKRLGIIGGGPIGCELAQAFRRLGAEVVLFQGPHILLRREEKEAQQLVAKVFQEEGVELHTGCEIERLLSDAGGITVEFRGDGPCEKQNISHLLIATGRLPNVEALSLERIGVKQNAKGIWVDRYGRTSVKHLWAIGDVTGEMPFTHMAEYDGRKVLNNLLLPWPFWRKRWKLEWVPRVTFTAPEVASIGLTEAQATVGWGANKIAVYTVSMDAVDRAITAGETEGFIKIVTKKWSSRILGATIVAPRAGEMLMEVGVAVREGIPLRKLAGVIHPYPTYSGGVRRAADLWLKETVLPLLIRRKGT